MHDSLKLLSDARVWFDDSVDNILNPSQRLLVHT